MQKVRGNWRYVVLVGVLCLCVLALAGCSGDDTDAESDSPDNAAESRAPAESGEPDTDTASDSGEDEGDTERKQVLIGTAGGPSPYGWIDEDGELDGYDYAVIQAVQELLPQYEFVVEVTEFASIFAGIDSGRYLIGVNNISWREEREEKYLFSEEHYIYNTTVVVLQKGREDIQSLEDLGGKTTVVGSSGAYPQLFVEEYNEEHPDNPILITYADQDTLKSYQDIVNGVTDFFVSELASVLLRTEEFGLEVDYIELPREEQEKIQNPRSYWIYPQTEEGEAIRADVDEAIRTLAENGTLSEIAIEYFGFDMSR